MNAIEGLLYGLSLALTPELLLAALVGALAGTLIGVLPGLGPVAGAALILPLTFAYEPVIGIIIIAGVYLGAQYGGSITSVLLNIPGDASAIVATFDGHQMAKSGRGGAALTIMAVGSFIAGLIGVAILLLTIPIVSSVALKFGAVEFLVITAGGLLLLARITGGSLGSGLLPMVLGLALATVGTEPSSSANRFTFGNLDLTLGVALAPVAVGIYGISELLYMIEEKDAPKAPLRVRMKELLPTRSEFRRAAAPWGRGSLLGFLFGILPGPSATLSTFASYRIEKAISKKPQEFGKGAVEGLAGPEAANNSAAIGSIVPVLMLGLPFSATLALMISAMTVQGIQPGPLLITQQPDLFWSVVASILVANVMLLVLNLPLVGMWVRVLRTPWHFLIAGVMLLAVIGAYSINNNHLDIRIMLVMGVIGYVLRKLNFSLASLLVGLVLGPLVEKYFVQVMLLHGGSLGDALSSSPIAVTILVLVGLGMVIGPVLDRLNRRRKLRDRSDDEVAKFGDVNAS
ncbi:tripartite tricarboxylate transporter permease [Aeromicrobium sp. CF4.19]|uniref:tripartite tricarboxylate transporter permease n=1 Tax=Aeromicrobium sp. CF4.19 TaxID=3373082 RepID=UPI003EE681FE